MIIKTFFNEELDISDCSEGEIHQKITKKYFIEDFNIIKCKNGYWFQSHRHSINSKNLIENIEMPSEFSELGCTQKNYERFFKEFETEKIIFPYLFLNEDSKQKMKFSKVDISSDFEKTLTPFEKQIILKNHSEFIKAQFE